MFPAGRTMPAPKAPPAAAAATAAAAAAAPAAPPADRTSAPDKTSDRFADMTRADEYAGPQFGFISLEEAVRERDRMHREADRMSNKCDGTHQDMQEAYEAADRWQRRGDRARANLAR